nr:RNA-directed DNA polymerase homolog [Tanacetum cinerariifolium]
MLLLRHFNGGTSSKVKYCYMLDFGNSVGVFCIVKFFIVHLGFDDWGNELGFLGLVGLEPVDVSDLESLYSLDDEPSDSVLCTISYSNHPCDDDSDIDSLEGDYDFGVHMINPIPHVLPIQKDPSLPLAKNHLLMDSYAKPISVIAFFDTGIKPEDRPKMAFYIPDHQYQWKVMSFSLKNAPSAFQKAMITIFEPILANTTVYIDDILMFSLDEQSHAELVSKFYSLVTKYGIMLSEKKMEVRVTTIQFLGMEISDGKYQPQPHVAQELLKFPDELSSQKMIQQFLG